MQRELVERAMTGDRDAFGELQRASTTDFSDQPVVGEEIETKGAGVHLFDNDGELLHSFATPGREHAVEFQRLAPKPGPSDPAP